MVKAEASFFQGQQRRWRIAQPTTPSDIQRLSDLPPLVAGLLYNRGLRTAGEAREFLDVDDSLLEDPSTLPDIGRAVERLTAARDRGETVAVYGDFDADGVTGTALLVRALVRYGIHPVPYIPHRVDEGHGLNDQAVQQLHQEGVGLIVTVDCGVMDIGPIALGRTLGVDTIVTDHHSVNGPLPEAAAIINPHAPGSTYAFHDLTGVGMALKLSQLLLEPAYRDRWADGLLELAAIGTITDMAPLVHENRYIVHWGLRQLRRTTNLGLQALIRSAGAEPSSLSAESIGFALGPRLNAVGRLGHAMAAYELLMAEEPARAESLAADLEQQNDQRRQLTEETLHACRWQVLQAGELDGIILVGSPEYNPGVVGLTAGRLADEFGLPAAVYALDGELVRASCRGGPNFHWAQALASCQDLLLRHGGHAQAAGFTCHVDNVPELRERLTAIADERLGGRRESRDGYIDAEVEPRQLMGPTFQALRRMEPFGIGNPAPVFLTRGVEVENVRTMGSDGQHLRLRLRSGGAVWDAVAFRQAWQPGTSRADIAFTLDVDQWNGTSRLHLTVQDYAPA